MEAIFDSIANTTIGAILLGVCLIAAIIIEFWNGNKPKN